MKIKVNGKYMEAQEGQLLLDVLRENKIDIPTLCHIKDLLPSGACRMCVVEDMKSGRLITSCSNTVADGMEIKTHSPRVINSRKTITELLLSDHPDDCFYCVRNNDCELRNLADNLRIRNRRIKGNKKKQKLDVSSESIVRDPEKCILCGRCVRVCEEIMGVSAIDFVCRGSETFIGTTFNEGLNTSSCINCGQCVMACPTGALTEKSRVQNVMEALNNPKKKVVVQYAPAISVSMSEEFGMEAGEDVNGLLNAALRHMGFDVVFDTTFSADLTIMEEATELIGRIQNGGTLPMFTSCCPGWVKYAEEFAPNRIYNLSSCKSPQQMLGAIIKSYFAQQSNLNPKDIYSVSIMPCTAKKFEGSREEMMQNKEADIDAVLTTRELVEMIKMFGIRFNDLSPQSTDSPLGARSTAGKLFGVSGGVMEAALRTAYFKLTGKELLEFQMQEIRGLKGRKEAKININGLELGVAVVSGLKNAEILLKEIEEGRKDLHFIEVMACPGGCIGGGGQLHSTTEESLKRRMNKLYQIDRSESIKVSHKNPEVIELYNNFLGEPNGHKSHELLHTSYCLREVLI